MIQVAKTNENGCLQSTFIIFHRSPLSGEVRAAKFSPDGSIVLTGELHRCLPLVERCIKDPKIREKTFAVLSPANAFLINAAKFNSKVMSAMSDSCFMLLP